MEYETVYFDTETTGLGKNAEIVQVGLVDQDGNVLMDTLVQCQGDMPQEAFNVHGISKEMLADAPTWPDIHNQVIDIIKRAKNLKIYNAGYDLNMISQTAKRHGLELPNLTHRIGHSIFCVMKEYADRYFFGEWVSLVNACKYEGVDLSRFQAHNAVGDCLMTREIDMIMKIDDERTKRRAIYLESVRRQKLELVPSDTSNYPYFGQVNRPYGYKTTSQLTKREIKNYEFAGTCCSTYGDVGYLFKPKVPAAFN